MSRQPIRCLRGDQGRVTDGPGSVTSGTAFGSNGFVGGAGGRENAPVTTAIPWLLERVSLFAPLVWRLKYYGLCLGLVLVSVPFLHLYLEVDLSPGELAIHSVDIALGALALIATVEIVGSAWQRQLVWRVEASRWLLTLVALLSGAAAISLQGWVHDLLPQTAAIRAKHVDAGYADMSVRVVPMVGLIGFLMVQAVREGALRRELARLHVVNEQLKTRSRGSRPEPAERVPFRHEKNDVLLDPTEIAHVAAEENYCRIRVVRPDARDLLVRSTLAETLAKLPAEDFLQVHRSHVVGRRHVAEVVRTGRSWALRVAGAGTVPVSRGRVSAVRSWLDSSFGAAS